MSFGATNQEAQQALSDFNDWSGVLMRNLSDVAQSQWDLLHSQLDDEVAQATQNVDDLLALYLEKINTISSNLDNVQINVTSCTASAQQDLTLFADDVKERLDECYGTVIIDGNGQLDASWSRVTKQYSTLYSCSRVSYIQCRDYEDTSDCYDFVISNIDRAKDSMIRGYDILRAEILNQVQEMVLPCKAMILQEMNLYPTLLMDFLGNCVESVTASYIVHGC